MEPKRRVEKSPFEVLVIGLSNVGKSTLIQAVLDLEDSGFNNIEVTCHQGHVDGLLLSLHEIPGFGAIGLDDEVILAEVKRQIPRASAFVCCLSMADTTINEQDIKLLESLNKIGINWKRTVFALTRADAITAPASERKKPGFSKKSYFQERLEERRQEIQRKLAEFGGVSVVCTQPTAEDKSEELPGDLEWFVPFISSLKAATQNQLGDQSSGTLASAGTVASAVTARSSHADQESSDSARVCAETAQSSHTDQESSDSALASPRSRLTHQESSDSALHKKGFMLNPTNPKPNSEQSSECPCSLM